MEAEDSDKLKSPSPANKMSITFQHNQDLFFNVLKHHLYTEYIICFVKLSHAVSPIKK